MPQWYIPAISRRLKRLSLGMPKASPSSSTIYQVISSETIFLFGHILCTLLGTSVCFYFLLFFAISLVGPQHSCVGERHAPLFHVNTQYSSFLSSCCISFSSCFAFISYSELLEQYSLVFIARLFRESFVLFHMYARVEIEMLRVVVGIVEKIAWSCRSLSCFT